MGTSIRVLVVDDHDVVRRGLSVFLNNFDDLTLCGEAANAVDALRLCRELHPDVVLMDVGLPDADGLSATRAIRRAHPSIQVVILTGSINEQSMADALQAGAVAYMLKNVSVTELANTIRAAYEGKPTFSSEVTQALINLAVQPRTALPEYNLTERERTILALMVEGLNNQAIADKLFVSRATVKAYISTLLAKLGVSNRIEAVRIAIERHLIPEQ